MVKIKPNEISKKRSIANKRRISFFSLVYSSHFPQFIFQLLSFHFYSNFNSIFIEKLISVGRTVETHGSIFVRSFWVKQIRAQIPKPPLINYMILAKYHNSVSQKCMKIKWYNFDNYWYCLPNIFYLCFLSTG